MNDSSKVRIKKTVARIDNNNTILGEPVDAPAVCFGAFVTSAFAIM